MSLYYCVLKGSESDNSRKTAQCRVYLPALPARLRGLLKRMFSQRKRRLPTAGLSELRDYIAPRALAWRQVSATPDGDPVAKQILTDVRQIFLKVPRVRQRKLAHPTPKDHSPPSRRKPRSASPYRVPTRKHPKKQKSWPCDRHTARTKNTTNPKTT